MELFVEFGGESWNGSATDGFVGFEIFGEIQEALCSRGDFLKRGALGGALGSGGGLGEIRRELARVRLVEGAILFAAGDLEEEKFEFEGGERFLEVHAGIEGGGMGALKSVFSEIHFVPRDFFEPGEGGEREGGNEGGEDC